MRQRAELEDWFRRTSERTPGGQWGISIGADGRTVLWSMSPELDLIPASTTKVFTTGFSRRSDGRRRPDHHPRDRRTVALDSAAASWQSAAGRSSWAAIRRWTARAAPARRCGSWPDSFGRRGIRVLEGPLSITSRTGPAESRYPSVWSPDYEGRLYAPPVGPVTLHENIVSLTFRPGT